MKDKYPVREMVDDIASMKSTIQSLNCISACMTEKDASDLGVKSQVGGAMEVEQVLGTATRFLSRHMELLEHVLDGVSVDWPPMG